MEKKSSFFLFFKIAYITHKGTIRHIAWLHVSSFLFKIQCFYRDENDLAPDDQYYITGKWNTLYLATFLKNDNSRCIRYTRSFN